MSVYTLALLLITRFEANVTNNKQQQAFEQQLVGFCEKTDVVPEVAALAMLRVSAAIMRRCNFRLSSFCNAAKDSWTSHSGPRNAKTRHY